MLGSTIVTLGLANTLLHGGHVRIDIFYSRLSAKGKAIIDGGCFLLIFLPLLIVIILMSVKWAAFSWSTGEKMIETTWYPPKFPIRVIFLVGWFMFGLQALAQFVRDLHLLSRGKSL
jgi:TRAP-type mannitol/chloroaromatic compound transport system permease small subunit